MAGGQKRSGETAAQLKLRFPPSPPRYDRASFHESASNRTALALVERWPAWPSHAAALFAIDGSGKTHLAHIWAARSGAQFLPASGLDEDRVLRLSEGFRAVVDDADIASPTETGARALFFLLNRAAQEGGSVLLTGQTPPRSWRTELPDLRTRLGSIPAAEIDPPDDGLLAAALTKSFADRQLDASPALIGFIVARIERNFAAAEQLVSAMDQATLGTGRALSLDLAERLIAGQSRD